MIYTNYCANTCCKFITSYYHNKINYKFKQRYTKAGFFIYNKETKMVLLIQSKGSLWGFPKGTCEKFETIFECAVRELYEETGLQLTIDRPFHCIKVYDNSFYYLLEISHFQPSLQIQNSIHNNDVSGIGWFQLECLYNLCTQSDFSINSHCRFLLNKFFDLKLRKNKLIKNDKQIN